MVRIAVDAMGGDHAPLAIARGAEAACAEKIAEVLLVGDEDVIVPLPKDRSGIEIVHTAASVDMSESPSVALRRKKDSSMNVAFSLVKSGRAHAAVSAGNSGATMAFAIFTLGRIPGVRRPAILTLHTTANRTLSALIDAGGTVDCRPSHLVQFALMGNAFAQHALDIPSPRVGLLSNGQEESKGNELTRKTHAILKDLPLNYLGYVVVTDGFVGNVALKVSEGVAEVMIALLKEQVTGSAKAKMGYLLLSDVFKSLSRTGDYSEYGGVPPVGVDGICIICHGKSNERAIKNAILQARNFANRHLNDHIKDAMQNHPFQIRSKEQ